MKIISIVNQKGGVAKTSSTLNIGKGLQLKGKRVLLIDFDPQANLTTGLGINKIELKYTVYDYLKKFDFPQYRDLRFEDVAVEKEGLYILPTNIKMSKIEMEMGNLPARENFLKDLLKEITDFDYVLIDCPPTLGLLTHNALSAADEVFIPVQAEPYAVEGVADLIDTIAIIKHKINNDLKIGGVFITMVDSRTNLHSIIKDKLNEYFKEEIFKTHIRKNIKIPESTLHGMTIFHFDPRSHGADDYMNLCEEILNKEKA